MKTFQVTPEGSDDLPEVVTGHWYFWSLYVEGVRRPRARFPKLSPDVRGATNALRPGSVQLLQLTPHP